MAEILQAKRLAIKCVPENKKIHNCIELDDENHLTCDYRSDLGYCTYPKDGNLESKEIKAVFDKLGQLEDEAEREINGYWIIKDYQVGNPANGFCPKYGTVLRCSECGASEFDLHNKNFCPNCGEKMDIHKSVKLYKEHLKL